MNDYTVYPTDLVNVLYFEHNHFGDEAAGKMWFEDGKLVDYDGVFELPAEIILKGEEMGLDMDYAK